MDQHLGVRDEEHLLRGELLQAGQGGLGPLALHAPHVGAERLTDAAVVGDVLSLRHLAVEVGVLLPEDGDELGDGVVAVLVDEALGLDGEGLDGL